MAERAARRRYLTLIGGSLVAVILLVGFVWLVRTMMASKSSKQSQRRIEFVQIIRPPPPPPPDQSPPPPEKLEQPLPKDEPEPTPKDESPPPLGPLGIDADASAGGDAFGLAARSGGSDLIGGTGNAAFAWYTNRLKEAVTERLSADSRIGAQRFSISVRVWIEPDGRIREVKLTSSTGNHDLDQRIEAALAQLTRLTDAPPLEMPQPISLKVVSHS
jgi:periplasmic protein TonB